MYTAKRARVVAKMLLLLLLSAGSPVASTSPLAPQDQELVPPSKSGGLAVADGALPPWAKLQPLSLIRRRLLSGTPAGGWHVDAVVAQGGDGNYTNIYDALKAAAPDGRSRYTVLVKAGIYDETLTITRKNVVLLGDGVGKTVITGNKSNKTGTEMINTPTVTVFGHGFLVQDITIRNIAGPDGKQAVAFRSNSNKSIVHRCSIEGFQDTIYAENNLQLYLDTDITGTIDFIFGNAKAVFHSCRLLVRRPVPGQHNIVTAQGRDSPDHDSGFVFQNCTVEAMVGEDLSGVDTYLGRPWKEHSRVVFMDSYLGEVINATGWVPWDKDKEVKQTTETVTYLEYNNRGPKAYTSRRVKWRGFRVITNHAEAMGYTADRLIDGSNWVPTLIRYNNSLPAPGLAPAPATA